MELNEGLGLADAMSANDANKSVGMANNMNSRLSVMRRTRMNDLFRKISNVAIQLASTQKGSDEFGLTKTPNILFMKYLASVQVGKIESIKSAGPHQDFKDEKGQIAISALRYRELGPGEAGEATQPRNSTAATSEPSALALDQSHAIHIAIANAFTTNASDTARQRR